MRTGCGKSPVSRYIAAELRKQGWHPVVIRHPMPYGDLAEQRAQRFGTLADLDRYKCTIEEREEYEPHIIEGTPVYAGVDYDDILRQAEKEADVILWDGGNNDTSFYRPDLSIVVLDPHRAGHELGYYPGEVNFRSADVLIINKVDTADPDGIKTAAAQHRSASIPKAKVIETACRVSVANPEAIERQDGAGGGRRPDAHPRRDGLRGRRGRREPLSRGGPGRSPAVRRWLDSEDVREVPAPLARAARHGLQR